MKKNLLFTIQSRENIFSTTLQKLLMFSLPMLLFFCGNMSWGQTTVTIGTGTASTYTYGPIYRSSASSSFDYSRYHYVFTASELSSAGILSNSVISSLAWNKTSAFVLTGAGSSTLKVHVKNSGSTVAATANWTDLTAGSSLVVDNVYDATNNVPSATGYWTLTFSTPFLYSGGSIEVSVDWDCSGMTLTSPTTGAFNWQYGSVGFNASTYGNNSTPITATTTVNVNRPNTQFTYTYTAPTCPNPTSISGSVLSSTSADLGWTAGGSESLWNIEWGPSGFVQGTGTMINGHTSNNYNLTGLMPIYFIPILCTSRLWR